MMNRSDEDLMRAQGYVQAHVPHEPLAEAVAFLCGVKGMVQGVTEVLVRQGVPKDRIYVKFIDVNHSMWGWKGDTL